MERLSADTLKVLSGFLTGQDAFNLSHTSSWWFKYVGDGSVWQRRLRSLDSWHKKLMVTPSLLFQSRRESIDCRLDSFAYLMDLTTHNTFQLTNLDNRSFSFDVWFSLLPASDGHYFGGILYGLQSLQRDSRPWPPYHQPVVIVNSSGCLYCSVLNVKPVVATDLKPSQWYHLGLSYDHNLQRQDVYLNGKSVRSDIGPLHEEWSSLSHEQVGTGCVFGGTLDFPYRGFLGWYGFRGIIDEFRVWEGVFHAEDAAELAQGGSTTRYELSASLKLNNSTSMLTSLEDRWVNVTKVSCTRPTEDEKVECIRSSSNMTQ